MQKYLNNVSQKNQSRWLKNCNDACAKCKMCQKDTREYDQCWGACDDCNKCHASYVRSKVYNMPYEYAHPLVSRKLNEMALPKQFCENICNIRMCDAYRKRMKNYTQCQRCQLQGKCWSPYQQRCIDCGFDRANTSCESKYGCPNPNGMQYGYVAPINPMFTDCKPCWDLGTYTT